MNPRSFVTSYWSMLHRRMIPACLTAVVAFGSLFQAADLMAGAFTAGNIVVYRVGDGTSANLANTGNPVFLDEYTPTGTLLQSVPLPTTVSGSNKRLIASGTATSEGGMTRSTDGQYLVAIGYDAAIPTTGLSSTASTSINRVIARVSAAGVVDTTTALTDALTGNNPRGVASVDGSGFWIAGGAGGIRYATLGATTSTSVSTTVANLRQPVIFGGQLYTSSSSGTARLMAVGTGLPTTTGQTTANIPGSPTTGSPYGMFFADLDASVPGVDTLYVCDDAAGIQKYSLVGGTWTSNGVVGTGTDTYRGITGSVTGSSVTLYVTRKGGSTATGGGEIATLIDTAGYNATITATPTTVATAAANTALRGIAFAPVAPATAPTIATHPASTTITSGNATTLTVTANGTAPLSYQWYQGIASDTSTPVGTNSASFTTPALNTTTSYWVRVTNSVGSVDSNTAMVTVQTLPSVLSITPVGAATSVAINSTVTLNFSTAVSLTSSAVTIEAPTGTPVSFSGLPATSVSSVTLTPSAALPYGTIVTVTVDKTKVTDGNSNSPAANFVSSFTTVAAVAPAISASLSNPSVQANGSATLSVVATGTPTPTYQWYRGVSGDTSTPVGTNSASFTTPALAISTSYWVRATNAGGSADSTTASVTVIVSPVYTSANRDVLTANTDTWSSSGVSQNGTQFINLGLQGVGRIPASAVDPVTGESIGSVSDMQVTGFVKNNDGTYSGTFNFLPDRGFNSGSIYSNYAARINQATFSFTPYTSATATTAQNQIAMTFTGSSRFTYDRTGNGDWTYTTGLLADGVGSLFSTPMPITTAATTQSDATVTGRLTVDAEGLVLDPRTGKTGSGWVSDEYGAYIYHFNANKQLDGVLGMPQALIPRTSNAVNFAGTPQTGRRDNQGVEGLSLSPDGTRLFALMQSATIQDSGSGNQGRSNTRLLVYDVSNSNAPTAPIAQYVIQLPRLDSIGSTTNGTTVDRNGAQSSVLAINNHQFLVLARDGNGRGATGAPVFKSILLADIAGATDINGSFDAATSAVAPSSVLNASVTPINWTQALNLIGGLGSASTEVAKFGLNLNAAPGDINTICEKWEAMGLVSANDPANPNDYFLFVGNDNDFISGTTKYLDANGVIQTNVGTLENDTIILAYRVRIAQPAPTTVASGDVTSSSAILWAHSYTTGNVTFDYSTDATFATGVTSTTATVTDTAQPVKVSITGLSAGTTYYYRAKTLVNNASGTFKTAPATGSLVGLHFGISGDWRGELAPYPSVKNAAGKSLDFFLELGDTIYGDVPTLDLPTAQARSLSDYRTRFNEVYSTHYGLNTLADLRASTAIFAVIDDHEVTNDFSGGALRTTDSRFSSDTGTYINETQTFLNGTQAFREYHPIADINYGATGDPITANKLNLYRYSVQGKTAATFVLDTRSFRSAPLTAVTNPNDSAQVGAFVVGAFTPGRTLLGAAQKAQFKTDLLAAQSAGIIWKFVCVPEPIQNFGPLGGEDRFEGYAAERTELLKFIDDNKITNVVFVTADFHGTTVNKLSYQVGPGQAQIQTNSIEIITGAVAYDKPFGPTIVDLAMAAGLAPAGTDLYYQAQSAAGKEAVVLSIINPGLQALGYNQLSMTSNPLPNAHLINGYYTATNSYGWTEFTIDGTTQELNVKTWGIAPYDQTTLFVDPTGVTGRTPAVVSEFALSLKPAFNTAATAGLASQSHGSTIDLAAATGAYPAGGTFSGPGVTGGIFDPSTTSPGAKTITYSYNDSFGTAQSSTFTINVTPLTFTGVASGDADSSSAVLWTRLDQASAVSLSAQVSTDVAFTAPVSFNVTVDTSKDNTAKVPATGLTAGTKYYYRFVVAGTGETSLVGTFKTTPAANVAAPLHFAFSGDNDGLIRPYALASVIPAQNLDFYVNLGDVIYENASNVAGNNGAAWLNSPSVTLSNDSLSFNGVPRAFIPAGTPFATQAQLKADYEKKYRENFLPVNTGGQNSLQGLYAAQGNYTTWDNHELGNRKYIDGGAPAGGSVGGAAGTDMASGRGVDARNNVGGNIGNVNDVNTSSTDIMNRAPGWQTLRDTFLSYQPIADRGTISAPSDPRTDGSKQLYSAVPWGKNALYVNTDARSYRDIRLKTANAGADDTGSRADNPNRTYLGATQFAWLKQTLLDAQNNGTTWKFVSISDPIDQIGPIGGALTLSNLPSFGSGSTYGPVNSDGGKSFVGGYRAERNALLKFIADNKITNVVFMATDDHQNRINEVTYSPTSQLSTQSSYVKVPYCFSIVCGPLGATGPDLITNHTFAMAKQYSDSIVAAQTAAGVETLGLIGYPGLKNLVRDGDPTAGTSPQAVDFYSPDTFNFTTLDVSADGKTLTVKSIGMDATAQNAGIEYANGPQARTIFSFDIDAPTPIQAWRTYYLGSAANSGNSADTFDSDGDGVPNLLEYALGSNPTVSAGVNGVAILPRASVTEAESTINDRLSLVFNLNLPIPADITYTVQATDDLTTWTDVATKVGTGSWMWLGNSNDPHVVITNQSTYQSVKIGDIMPHDAIHPRRMMRLKVTAP